MLKYLLLLVGFALLIKGADYFVEGSSSVAKILRIPSIIIGLTIVAMGTSAPELAVSTTAGLAGKNEIAVSNVIGSNMFNLLVIGGICAIIQGMKVDSSMLKRDFPFAIGAGVILLFMSLDKVIDKTIGIGDFTLTGRETTGAIGRIDGIILLILFIIFLYLLVRNTLRARKATAKSQGGIETEEIKVMSVPKSILYIVGGAIAIVIGGQLVVDSSSEIATSFGLSQTLIGLTIVAVGTSLPELVTSLVAIKKGENDLALGNIVGSCIFNILFVLAISSICNPVGVTMVNVYDLIFLAITSLFMYGCAASRKNVNRAEGIVLFLAYIAYMVYAVMR